VSHNNNNNPAGHVWEYTPYHRHTPHLGRAWRDGDSLGPQPRFVAGTPSQWVMQRLPPQPPGVPLTRQQTLAWIERTKPWEQPPALPVQRELAPLELQRAYSRWMAWRYW
jgi:hypothetical protein